MNYYARNDEEREFDNTIREAVKKSKSKTHMAHFLQGQEELNLLRQIINNQAAFDKELQEIRMILNRQDELYEMYSVVIDKDSMNDTILKAINRLRIKIDDLTQYICEREDNEDNYKSIHSEALSMVRMHNARAKYISRTNPSEQASQNSLIWDYILCCLDDE